MSKHRRLKRQHDTKIDDRSIWDKFWRDSDDNVVIVQMPNIWIILWFVFEVISFMSASTSVATKTHFIATIFLGIWALLELLKGADYFRQILGLVFVVLTILSFLGRGI
ncbi:MAG: hypothetical protein ACHQT9_01865 [Candidatus Saccharimonadales bacterium]